MLERGTQHFERQAEFLQDGRLSVDTREIYERQQKFDLEDTYSDRTRNIDTYIKRHWRGEDGNDFWFIQRIRRNQVIVLTQMGSEGHVERHEYSLKGYGKRIGEWGVISIEDPRTDDAHVISLGVVGYDQYPSSEEASALASEFAKLDLAAVHLANNDKKIKKLPSVDINGARKKEARSYAVGEFLWSAEPEPGDAGDPDNTPSIGKEDEFRPWKKDAIVVLGKNLGVRWGAEEVAEQRFHLSPHSRINAIAAALLYKQGVSDRIVISTGPTVKGYSEAKLMKDHIQRIFKSIPDEAFILEENSLQTYENAQEVKRIADEMSLESMVLVTNRPHMKRASRLFREAGIDAEEVISEDVLAKKHPKVIGKYKKSGLYRAERGAEAGYRALMSVPIVRDRLIAGMHKKRAGLEAKSGVPIFEDPAAAEVSQGQAPKAEPIRRMTKEEWEASFEEVSTHADEEEEAKRRIQQQEEERIRAEEEELEKARRKLAVEPAASTAKEVPPLSTSLREIARAVASHPRLQKARDDFRSVMNTETLRNKGVSGAQLTPEGRRGVVLRNRLRKSLPFVQRARPTLIATTEVARPTIEAKPETVVFDAMKSEKKLPEGVRVIEQKTGRRVYMKGNRIVSPVDFLTAKQRAERDGIPFEPKKKRTKAAKPTQEKASGTEAGNGRGPEGRENGLPIIEMFTIARPPGSQRDPNHWEVYMVEADGLGRRQRSQIVAAIGQGTEPAEVIQDRIKQATGVDAIVLEPASSNGRK